MSDEVERDVYRDDTLASIDAHLGTLETHLDHIEQSLAALLKIGEVLLDCVVPVRQQTPNHAVLIESLAMRVASVGVLAKVQSGEEGGKGGGEGS